MGENVNRISSAFKVIVACLAIVLAGLLMWLALIWVSPTIKDMASATLRDSIVKAANQCFAIEGSYPPSLAYLEENYGVIINKQDYVVTYEVFADNVVPNIVVVPKNKG